MTERELGSTISMANIQNSTSSLCNLNTLESINFDETLKINNSVNPNYKTAYPQKLHKSTLFVFSVFC